MKIRLATVSDLAAINDIYNQAVRKRYCTADLDEISLKQCTKWFEGHQPEEYPVFAAVEDDRVVGWICYSAYRAGRRALQSAAEVSYYIHEEHLQKGIGTQLMQFVIDKAPKYQFKSLFAILLAENLASLKLLEKFGFERWGLMPHVADIDGEICDHLYYGRKV
ncbi:GNAT family N-acetyltransferase [Labilibaculum sp. A4]|uniref:GNAT family N-acetyltransferase n=1 Tax=Labilibaculum euxinus TaxID=2686357 RepID=UPI000F626AF4|nr:GNAT family N-acetyltransferase [Labilibaculum euxinus]MDQ1771811.1 N-acetyltransferase family protein [Labilibaculum euxinus]MWN77714.1 GNAT family N-acetyltransferase [Labilibaculum euxinus]